MTLNERIGSFSKLGSVLRESLDGNGEGSAGNMETVIRSQQFKNQWFTPGNVRKAIKAIADELTEENLVRWLTPYNIPDDITSPSVVGVVMAGNIPLVGFHDFLSVLITGNNLVAKKSSKDPDLIVFIAQLLNEINPYFRDKINFTEGNLSGFDMIIATGSDNSSRYFEYYFGKYPHIIRKNRNSVALISGNETAGEIELLGEDIFAYFGLGCRSVSKVYIPAGYDIREMIPRWASFSSVTDHPKYANNYDFNKAVFLVNREPFIDAGFILIRETKVISSPVAVLHYEQYDSLDEAENKIKGEGEKIQCVTGKNHIPFGQSQSPKLWDYADGRDTLEFLLKKNRAVIL